MTQDISRGRTALLNLGLALASLALVFGVIEALARFAESRRGGGKEDRAEASYTEHDPVLGWAKRPGGQAVYRRREYTVEVSINRRGLRDKERSTAPAPGVPRVLALGDSFVEGYTVPFPKSVTQVLEAQLSRGDCAVEVINGGTHGYSTDQEYLFYLFEGKQYAPSIVVLFFFYNDVLYNDMDNYWGTPKPLLELRDGKLVTLNSPVPTRARRPPTTAGAAPRRFRSAAYDWLRERLERGAPRAYETLAAIGVFPPRARPQPRDELRVFKKGPTPRMNGAWLKTRQILQALSREVEDRGARLLVVYIPTRFEVDDRAWRLTQYDFGMDDASWDRDLVRRRLSEIGQAVGFPVLDLSPPLRAGFGPLSVPYFTYDNHWNQDGHRIGALEVAGYLEREGWVPRCPTSR